MLRNLVCSLRSRKFGRVGCLFTRHESICEAGLEMRLLWNKLGNMDLRIYRYSFFIKIPPDCLLAQAGKVGSVGHLCYWVSVNLFCAVGKGVVPGSWIGKEELPNCGASTVCWLSKRVSLVIDICSSCCKHRANLKLWSGG